MELRKIIIRVTGISVMFIILAITMYMIAYKEHNYTYVIGDDFKKSSNCYIDDKDNRVCETKKGIIKVDYYYEED